MNEFETSVPPRSTIQSFSNWLFRWKTFRRALIALIGLITLAALVITEENWRGKRDWEQYKAEQEARGEHLDLAWFTPKPVPPEQNFYATPFLAPLLDYEIINGEAHFRDSNGVARAKSLSVVGGALQDSEHGDLKGPQKYFRSNTNFPVRPEARNPADDVLFALQQFDPILNEVRAASERPAAVFTTHPDRVMSAQLVMFGVLKTITQAALIHALASLEAGHPTNALTDVHFMFRLGQVLRGEPILISHLVRIAILNIALQPVREGLAKHRWSDEQLQAIQTLLQSDDLLEDYGKMMRGERAYGNELMGQDIAGNFGSMGGENTGFKLLGWFAPRGLFYQNQIVINRLHQQFSLPAVDAAAHRVFPDHCGTNALLAALGKRTPYNILARMLFPAFQKVALRFAYTQAVFDQATLACALERYRLANGSYPETLAALAPRFIAKIPGDIIGGQPLHYRRTGDGTFLLYSIGWNERDDGGALASKKSGRDDIENGDWVWPSN